jgi:DNA-binding NarL/FixJ family response regulator
MPAERQPISVLLIDPNDVARAGLKALLADEPRFTVVGETATDGVLLARRLRPRLILIERAMRNSWNLAPIRELATAAPDTCLCVYTAITEPRLFVDAMRAGARAYLLKGTTSGAFLLDAFWLVGRFHATIVDATMVERLQEESTVRLIFTEPSPQGQTITGRERAVLEMLASGASDKEIATSLSLGRTTVQTYVYRLQTKLGAKTRTHLGAIASRRGLIPG